MDDVGNKLVRYAAPEPESGRTIVAGLDGDPGYVCQHMPGGPLQWSQLSATQFQFTPPM